jgi:Domain of unknown function (DUF4410)
MVGGAETSDEKVLDTTTPPPRVMYVTDFSVDDGAIKAPSGLVSNVHEAVTGIVQDRPHILGGGGILGRRATPDTPTADEVVNTLAASLTDSLNQQNLGIPVYRIPPGGPLPSSGWVIKGRFISVDPGNRAERAVVGFGTGEATTEVLVEVDRLASDTGAPVLQFGTGADSGKMPGAAVTMNPYVAAAKFVMGKQATTRDVRAMGAEIAKQIADAAHQRGVGSP